MRRQGAHLLIALAWVSIATAQSVPAQLAEVAAKAGLDRPVTAWCSGEFRAGRPGAFAVAVTSVAAGGRYLVLESDAIIHELGPFTRRPDLSCYTRAEADRLNVTIGRSDTIHGQLAPRWNTAVICAFADDTVAVCWQYSPDEGVFVRVGGWVT